MNLKRIAEKIEHPLDDYYFEKSSIDGYAFLGIAKHYLKMDTSYCEREMSSRIVGLNAEWISRGVKLHPNVIYAYSCYPTYEFYYLKGNQKKKEEIIDLYDNKLGVYPEGFIRYCDKEINYIVPNVSATASLSYARHGRMNRCIELVELLRKTQLSGGNWDYITLPDVVVWGTEDLSHLSMMVIALRELEMFHNIETSDIVDKSIECLNKMCIVTIPTGTHGWGSAYLYLATLGMDEKLNKRAKKGCIESTRHKNFRTRAISLWSLVKGAEWSIMLEKQ